MSDKTTRRQRSSRRFVIGKAPFTGAWLLPGWDAVCRALSRHGELRWNRQAKGWELTESGRQAKRELQNG